MHDTNLFGFLHSFGLADFECLDKKLRDNANENCYGSPPYAAHFKMVLYT